MKGGRRSSSGQAPTFPRLFDFMASKVFILKGGYVPPKEAFGDKSKAYIITTEKETIPVSVLAVVKGDFELVFAGEGSKAEYAFALGKIAAQAGSIKLYTNDEELKKLINSDEPQKTTRKRKAMEQPNAFVVKGTLDPSFMNIPDVKTSEKKEETKEPEKKKAAERKSKTKSSSGELPKVSEEEIKKLLKKSGYDEKYVKPVMDAFKLADNRLTIDLFVRTKVSLMENDQKIVVAIGDLIKKEYGA